MPQFFYKINNKLLLICSLLIFFTFNLVGFAQSGSLKGNVTDRSTNQPLTGANVIVQGTSFGAATDFDGDFLIRNIPVGQYNIVVSYLGYVKETVNVNIIANRTLEETFSLNPDAIEGGEVLITAQAEGQQSAIQQQLTSDKISNIVSESRIQELPDFNAAQALSRLPGVSTLQSSGEANKVVIRGLAPQYNSVQIEGMRLASTGSTQIGASSLENTAGQINNDRSVDLSMITPYMIKTIAVYKALTPDQNANAIGGTVNMELREAPSGLRYDVLWQSGYTQKSNQYGNYRGVISASARFFEDKLGVYFLGNLESYDRNADNMNAGYNTRSTEIGDNGFPPVTVRNVTLNRHIETRQRYGANLILDYRLPKGSIKAVNMFTRLNSEFQDHGVRLNYTGAGSGNIDFTYREGENPIDLALNSIDFKYDFDLFEMDLKLASTYSLNKSPDSPLLSFNQTGGIKTNEVDDNIVPEKLTQYVTFYGDSSVYLRTISLFSTTYRENNKSIKSNFKFPFNIGTSLSGYVKFGGEYRHETHQNSQSTPYVAVNRSNTAGSIQFRMMEALRDRFGLQWADNGLLPGYLFRSGNEDLFKSFLDNEFGEFYFAADGSIPRQIIDFLKNNPEFAGQAGIDPGGWFDGPYQQLANDYVYKENYYAGYLMAELNFLDFMIVGGVRYEKDQSEYSALNMRDARNPQAQVVYPVKVEPENEFLLPMVQIKYQPLSWMDIRYAYTHTLARPDYHQLSPKYTINTTGTYIWAGNPNLKPAKAINHDLMVSLYSNKLGLFSVGGFYKTINEFTYNTQYLLNEHSKKAGLDSLERFQQPQPNMNADVTLNTYINSPYEAIVKGFEIDYQTSFWYLPFPLNGLVFGINYTRIESETKYPWRDQVSRLIPPRTIVVDVIDTTRVGRLINQPNDILNTYLGYDYLGFSIRFSFVFQGNSVSGIGRFAQQDGFTKDYFRMDISAKQKLPWEGAEVYLDIFNVNNENTTAAQRSISGFTNIQNYGLTANLGVRFRY